MEKHIHSPFQYISIFTLFHSTNIYQLDISDGSKGSPAFLKADPPFVDHVTPPMQLLQVLYDLRQPLTTELRRNAAVGGHTHGIRHYGGDQVTEGVILRRLMNTYTSVHLAALPAINGSKWLFLWL